MRSVKVHSKVHLLLPLTMPLSWSLSEFILIHNEESHPIIHSVLMTYRHSISRLVHIIPIFRFVLIIWNSRCMSFEQFLVHHIELSYFVNVILVCNDPPITIPSHQVHN